MRGLARVSAPNRILDPLGSNDNRFAGLSARLCPALAEGGVGENEARADRWLSGQKQQTVNLPTPVVYGGSNPPLSTKREVKSVEWQVTRRLQKSAVCQRGFWNASSAHSRNRDSSLESLAGGSNSVVESQPSKLLVAGVRFPSPAPRKQWLVLSGWWLATADGFRIVGGSWGHMRDGLAT